MRNNLKLRCFVVLVSLCMSGIHICLGQCAVGCDITNPGTSINSSSNGEVFCITSAPGSNINMNINHDDVTILICANGVRFNNFNINAGTDNFIIETWGNNTRLNGVNVGEDLFEFRVHGTGGRVQGGNFNSESRFYVTDGGDLLLNFGLNPGSPLNIVVDTNSTLNTQSITSNNGGSIEINEGAVMNVTGTLMFNNPTTITNHNELNITNDLVMQGGANSFSNACGESSVNVGGEFRIDAGSMDNAGSINTNNFRINSGGPLNLLEGASLDVTGNLEANNVTNSIRYTGAGGECAQFTLNNINNWNNVLTPDSEINYCGPAGGSRPGSATIGCACASTVTNCNVAMPVEFGEFDAIEVDQVVELHWSTITEINNNYFELLKSTDGSAWAVLGSVSGQGNSSQVTNYYFPDHVPINGVVYYRLRQVDFDGQFSYSKIISVNRGNGFNLRVYPNPSSNGEVNVSIDHSEGNETLLVLRDAFGRKVFSKVIIHESNNVVYALHEEVDLIPGVYIIIATNNEKLHQHKLIVR